MANERECSVCGSTKPTTDFYFRKEIKGGVNRRCKECMRAAHKLWCAANSARVKENNHRYYTEVSKVVPEAIAAKRASAQKWNNANRERISKTSAEWAKANPEKRRSYRASRRAKQRTARSDDAKLVAEYYAVINSRPGVRCYWCKRAIKKAEVAHVDHIYPIQMGGSNTVANLCVSCAKCNLSKGAKAPSDFSGHGELEF